MADKVRELAEGALRLIGGKAPEETVPAKPEFPSAHAKPEILDALFSGKKVIVSVRDLNCPNIGELRSELARFAGSHEGLVFEVEREASQGPSSKATAVTASSSVSPERQVLEEILADVISREGGSCVVEPGKTCVGCSGRCVTLGF